ncbi:hypothetical protein ACG04Q_13080 [Roseateles sp. DXS20W]|uniref:Uncharacterized protein n=1 Tax=Pelomonas lactea TaxID=3299030 RepID=A0ABW7GKP7_9BURK
MLNLRDDQMQRLGEAGFSRRLAESLARHDTDFAAMAADAQQAFVAAAIAQARQVGFRTEQGIAGYALGALWLGVGFEQAQPLLLRVLQGPLPEVRRVHALGEWVHDQLGPAATPASGEAALRRSFELTQPWGLQGGQR